MPSIDYLKRNTLKILVGTGVVMTAASTGLVSSVNAATARAPQQFPTPVGQATPDLSITLFSSDAVVENSLILRNNTDSDLKIEKFVGGHVVFNNSMFDLGILQFDNPISLAPAEQRSFEIPTGPIETIAPIECIWADSCVTPIGRHAVVVELGGYLVGQNVMVFIPATSVAS